MQSQLATNHNSMLKAIATLDPAQKELLRTFVYSLMLPTNCSASSPNKTKQNKIK